MGPHGPDMAIVDMVDMGTEVPHMELGVLLLGKMEPGATLPSTPGLLKRGKKSKLGGPRGPGPGPGFWGRAGRYWMVLGALAFT